MNTSFLFQPRPRPFKYTYSAGRAPNSKPDRYVEQEGDEDGVIRGTYTYLDPNWTWQTVRVKSIFKYLYYIPKPIYLGKKEFT